MDLRPNQDRCRYFEGLFSPYIDGGLDDAERRALADHLHECERCTQQFGLSWRRATARLRPKSSEKGRRKSGSGVWILAIASLLGVSLLGAMGFLDASENGRFDPLGRTAKNAMDEELGRMLHVQTSLLEAVVDPLRGTRQTISHAARGQARDFVERLEAIRSSERTGLELLEDFSEIIHPLLRVTDPQPGGRTWNRIEWLEEVGREGIPAVVLVEVVSAFREVLFVRLTWGKRPAYAWLLPEVEGEKSSSTTRFVLSFLLFAEP